MARYAMAALVAGAILAPVAVADTVAVPGSSARFARAVPLPGSNPPAALTLTGVALRTKLVFNVYAIASYVQDGTPARTPEELARAEAPRMLHLVMERTVSGKDFLDAFRTAVAKTYPPEKFAAEFGQLAAVFGDRGAAAGENVVLLYTPGAGLRVQVVGKAGVTIPGGEFARAVWEVYLGPQPIDEEMKRGLVKFLRK